MALASDPEATLLKRLFNFFTFNYLIYGVNVFLVLTF